MKKSDNLYEGMYVISPQLSEGARTKAVERITKEIEKTGGKIHKVHDLGRKKLAYEIERHREGYYYLIYFECQAGNIDELIKEYHLNEDLLRFMMLRTEEVKQTIEFKQLARA